MKKIFKITSLMALLLVGTSTNIQNKKDFFEEYNFDILSKTSIPTKQVKKSSDTEASTSVNHSKIFYQTGEDATAKYLRFVTAVDGSKELESIEYTRTLTSKDESKVNSTKVVNVDTIYKGVVSGGVTKYYNPTTGKLTDNVDEFADYFFACYTIKFSTDTYKDTDITLSISINGVEDSTTTTVKLWDLIDEYKLVFDNFASSEYFVGDTINLEAYGVKDGIKTDDKITYEVTNATLNDNKVTLDNSGDVAITATYQGQSITQNIKVFNKVSTTSEFLAIGTDINSMKDYYKLVNDLDFEGTEITAFSSYNSYFSKSETYKGLYFDGIFDGQSYTIANFEPKYNTNFKDTDRDCSIFGYLSANSIVKNTNFIGVKLGDRSSVVSSFSQGTISNCYVEATYIKKDGNNKSTSNPAGVIVSKMSTGTISNCVTKLDVASDAVIYADKTTTVCLGSFVGAANGGKITNCYSICADSRLNFSVSAKATLTNTNMFASIDDFYANVDTTLFNSNWTFDATNKLLPHLLNIGSINVTKNAESYNNSVFDLSSLVSSTLTTFSFSLKDEMENVSIDGSKLNIGNISEGTKIVVLANDSYSVTEITITVKDIGLSATSVDSLSFDFIKGESEETEYTKAHNVKVVTAEGTDYTGEVTIASSNTSVATVVGDNIVAVGDGTATISVSALGTILKEFTVNSIMYNPIKTVEDYVAIGKDKTTLSLKYKLMNDIDFENQRVNTLAHYSAGYTSNTNGFSGIFDGQGYSLKNISFGYNNASSANSSAFGTVAKTGVIKNVNVINATIDNSISGTIATMNYGTISNCYVSCTISSTSAVNNPLGSIVSKNFGTLDSCVASLDITASSSVAIGAIAGRNYSGAIISNCVAIAKVGVVESGTPTNGGNKANVGTISNSASFETLAALISDETIDTSKLTSFTFTDTTISHNGQVVYTA